MKKNHFVLIFLTIVTILAVWYIKTPSTAQTNNDISQEEETLAETSRLEAFEKMREVIRNERSIETVKYDNILADELTTVEEKANALSSKERLSSTTEKELLLELQVINLGYRDAFVHATSNGVEVTVISEEVSAAKANEIILMTLSSFETETGSVVVNFTSVEDYQ